MTKENEGAPARTNESLTGTASDAPVTHASSASVPLPEEARALYRRLHGMPKPARQFAFNMIEILKLGTVNGRPMGDHDIQDPKRFLRVQLERFEQAMK